MYSLLGRGHIHGAQAHQLVSVVSHFTFRLTHLIPHSVHRPFMLTPQDKSNVFILCLWNTYWISLFHQQDNVDADLPPL